MLDDYVWSCACCGEEHKGLPMAFGFMMPDAYGALSERRRARSVLDTDVCIFEERSKPFGRTTHRFVRTVLPFPVRPSGEEFHFGVWASVSEATFESFITASQYGTESEGPYFSYLCNSLPEFPTALATPCELWLQPAGIRPRLFVHDPEHPLAIAQREGIDVDLIIRVAQFSAHQAAS